MLRRVQLVVPLCPLLVPLAMLARNEKASRMGENGEVLKDEASCAPEPAAFQLETGEFLWDEEGCAPEPAASSSGSASSSPLPRDDAGGNHRARAGIRSRDDELIILVL